MRSNQSLDRRAVACRSWRWLPGMLVHDIGTSRIGRVHKAGRGWIVYYGLTSEARFRRDTTGIGLTTDLSDPPTLGCLLALVREAWGDPYAFVEADPLLGFRVVGNINDGPITGWHSTEAEALVAALEAAS